MGNYEIHKEVHLTPSLIVRHIGQGCNERIEEMRIYLTNETAWLLYGLVKNDLEAVFDMPDKDWNALSDFIERLSKKLTPLPQVESED